MRSRRILAFKWILFMATSLAPLHALAYSHDLVHRWYSEAAHKLRQTSVIQYPTAARTQTTCSPVYNQLFTQPELTVAVFFGYGDKPDYQGVFDQSEKTAFFNELQKSCSDGYHACGFEPHSTVTSNPAHLSKILIGSNQRPLRLRILAYHSSATSSDSSNRERLGAEQRQLTEQVSEDFFASLTTADFVFYLGHARYGTGFGFSPLERFSLNSLWRLLAKPFHDRLNQTLRSAARQPSLIGILSCDSEHYYGPAIAAAAPSTGLITFDDSVQFPDLNGALLGAINALLGQKCGAEFTHDINAYNINGNPARVTGFFN